MAAIATFCFSIYPLHIKHSNISSSESLFILCTLLVIYAYVCYHDHPSFARASFLTIALFVITMIRFEGWMLFGLTALALHIRAVAADHEQRKVRLLSASLITAIASLFIIFWIYNSYLTYGDPFYSVHAAAGEHINLMQSNARRLGEQAALVYNALFWPGVMLLSLTPFVFLAGLISIFANLRREYCLEIGLLFVIQLGIYSYRSIIVGDLAPLARYTILPGTILCLFSGYGIFNISRSIVLPRHIRILFKIKFLFVALIIYAGLLSFNYYDVGYPALRKFASISPYTHYPKDAQQLISWIHTNINQHQRILIPAQGYCTNVILAYSKIDPTQLMFFGGEQIDSTLTKISRDGPNFLIVHRDDSNFQKASQLISLGPTKVEGLRFSLNATVGNYQIYKIIRSGVLQRQKHA